MDRIKYTDECRARWHRQALVDALHNWGFFRQHHDDLTALLMPFVKDCTVPDLAGKCQNPEGTLTAWLWKCSEANPWIWDFCEHYQKCHLRRGLIAYCKQMIEGMRTKSPPEQAALQF